MRNSIEMRYSIEPKERRYIKEYPFYPLLEILVINMIKN